MYARKVERYEPPPIPLPKALSRKRAVMSAVLTGEIKNEKLCSQTEDSTKIKMHNTCQSYASVVNPIAPPRKTRSGRQVHTQRNGVTTVKI